MLGRNTQTEDRLAKGLMSGSEPFVYKGKRDTACLMIHGFTSTPQTMRELAEVLQKSGFSCYAPLLPGHGTHVDELNKTSWNELEESISEHLLEVSRRYKKVVLVGESSGGTIAARLAARYPSKVAGVISVGGAFLFPIDKVIRTLMPVYKYLKPIQKKVKVADVFDRSALHDRVAYSHVPSHAFHDLLKYAQKAIRDLPKVKAPLLVLHARQDHTISPRSVQLLKKETRSKYKKIIWYPKSYHNLLIDLEKQRVFKDINKFVRRVDDRFDAPDSHEQVRPDAKKQLAARDDFAVNTD